MCSRANKSASLHVLKIQENPLLCLLVKYHAHWLKTTCSFIFKGHSLIFFERVVGIETEIWIQATVSSSQLLECYSIKSLRERWSAPSFTECLPNVQQTTPLSLQRNTRGKSMGDAASPLLPKRCRQWINTGRYSETAPVRGSG